MPPGSVCTGTMTGGRSSSKLIPMMRFTGNSTGVLSRRCRKTSFTKTFLLCSMGSHQKKIADSIGDRGIVIEPGIGYSGIFSRYRVFESYAWMHYLYGETRQGDGSWYDAVIPNYFDPTEF